MQDRHYKHWPESLGKHLTLPEAAAVPRRLRSLCSNPFVNIQRFANFGS